MRDSSDLRVIADVQVDIGPVEVRGDDLRALASSRRATAAPMPDPAPVMSARLPAKRVIPPSSPAGLRSPAHVFHAGGTRTAPSDAEDTSAR
jgi:hypothetical protein